MVIFELRRAWLGRYEYLTRSLHNHCERDYLSGDEFTTHCTPCGRARVGVMARVRALPGMSALVARQAHLTKPLKVSARIKS